MNDVIDSPHCPVCRNTMAPVAARKNYYSCKVHGFFYVKVKRKLGRPRKVAKFPNIPVHTIKPYNEN